MKKIYMLMLGLFGLGIIGAVAQETTDGCGNVIREISTNPENPINEEWSAWYPNDVGSYINTGFSWYPRNQVIIPNEQNWNSEFLRQGNDIVMPWFFSNLNTQTGYLYFHPDPSIHYLDDDDKDWHWEDGWELMYLNIGRLPNGTPVDQKSDPNLYWNTDEEPIIANNSPYVVLYNRYTGLMRVFFSAWGDEATNWEDVTVSLAFRDKDIVEGSISGMFRHAEGLDRPLNMESKISRLKGARKQRINGPNEWYVAEFQLGYDICQCEFASNMYLKFKYTKSSKVDLNVRTIALEQGIANMDEAYWNFFQNMYNEDGKMEEAGNVLFPTMQSMSRAYESALEKYNQDLKDYNSFENQLKIDAIKALTDGLAGGIAGLAVPPTAVLRNFLLNNQLKVWKNQILLPNDTTQAKNWANSIEASAKKVLAQESDFISGMLGVKQKPSPPQMPVATFTEGKIKGKITDENEQVSTPLIVPGSMKSPNGISGQNFPVYNQVVGLFALLELPTFKAYENSETFSGVISGESEQAYFGWKENIVLQPLDVQVALNPALDFDLNKTSILGAMVIKIRSKEKHSSELDYARTYELVNSNFELNHRYIDQSGHMVLEFVSTYYDLAHLKNILFNLEFETKGIYSAGYSGGGAPSQEYQENVINKLMHEVDYEMIGAKFKIAADMYFDQIGSNEEQVNTFQAFTYNIWDRDSVYPNGLNFYDAIDYFGGETIGNTNWVTYLPGTLEVSGIVQPTDNFVWTVSGNDIIIRAENVSIINDVGPAEGYNLIIEAMNIDMDPNAKLLDNTELLSKWFYDNPQSSPIHNGADLPEGYCSEKYKANQFIASKREIMNGSGVSELDEIENISLSIYPNPANQVVNVKVTSGELTSCNVKVTTVTGQTLIEERVNNDLLNGFAIGVEHLTNGYYILELFSDDGYRAQKKFVIQH